MFRILLPNAPGAEFTGIDLANPSLKTLNGYNAEFMKAYLHRACEELVVDLQSAFLKPFLRQECTDESLNVLMEIYKRAAEFFMQLRTHRTKVYWCDPERMRLAGSPFLERGSDIKVRAHRSQHFVNNKHGKPILLVIWPYVALAGNEFGENYGKGRVVCDGMVLVDVDSGSNSTDKEESIREEFIREESIREESLCESIHEDQIDIWQLIERDKGRS